MAARKRTNVARSPEDLAKKRDLILDAALTLLMDKGYTKTTMSDVATAADMGRGTVYWHFDSKDDLFFSLVQREVAKTEQGLEPMLEMPGPAVDKLDLLTREAFAYYGDAGPLFQALMSILGGADEAMEQRMVAMMSELYGKYNGLVEALLEQGKTEGTVRPELDSPMVAAAIVVLLDAMFLQVAFGLIPNDPGRIGNAIHGLIHKGCRPCTDGHRNA